MDYFLDKRAEGFSGQKLYRVPEQVLKRIRNRSFTKEFIVTDLGFFPTVEKHLVNREKGSIQHIMIYVVKGSGWCKSGKKSFSLYENQALLIPSGHPHIYGADKNNPWSIFWIHFEGEGAQALLKWITDEHSPISADCNAPERLKLQFNSILDLVEKGYDEHTLLELSRSLINILTTLHRNPLKLHRNPNATERMEATMEIMRTQSRKPNPLDHYARHAGLSVAQFSHLFKIHTGISPMTYLTEIRMQQACEYLDRTDASIKAIALELGYDDPLYFSRAFKKCTGLSPKNYRERA